MGARQTKRTDIIIAVCAAAVMAHAVYASIRQFSGWYFNPHIATMSARLHARDIDHLAILAGFNPVTSFTATFTWWNHLWPGLFNYWRPLTSQAFWLEHHAFGDFRYDLWDIVSVLSNLIVIATIGLLARRLSGSVWTAMGAALIFSLPSQMGVAMFNWKDQPDIWVTEAVLLSLLATASRRWALALLFAIVAPCIKELGWISFLCNLMYLGRNALDFACKDRMAALREGFADVPRWLYAGVGVGIAALLSLMAVAGFFTASHVGTGHNYHWVWRYAKVLDIPWLGNLLQGDYAALPAAATILALRFLRPMTRQRGASVLLVGIGASMACNYFEFHVDFAVLLVFMLFPTFLTATVAIALWTYCTYYALRSAEHRPTILALTVMYLIASANIAIGLACADHVLYLANALHAILASMALVITVQALAEQIQAFRYSRPNVAMDGPLVSQ